MVAIRNWELFYEGQEMHDNFLQKSTETDQVNIYS